MRQQLSQSAFSEAKLGLVPAVISRYVIMAIGPRRAQQLFLTACKVDANQAREIVLVTEILEAETDPAMAEKSLAVKSRLVINLLLE
jgi:methylglutaconyl-CoA hydratase